jgi:hypothetical protein
MGISLKLKKSVRRLIVNFIVSRSALYAFNDNPFQLKQLKPAQSLLKIPQKLKICENHPINRIYRRETLLSPTMLL